MIIKSVGESVFEMREFFGSGWRMYYTQQGSTIILMPGGGDKSTQNQDIQKAIQLANDLGKKQLCVKKHL